MENITFHGPPMSIGAGSGDIGVGTINEPNEHIRLGDPTDIITSDPCDP